MTFRLKTPLSLCFDLDGTLIDTAPDLIRVLNTVIAQDGLSETNFKAARLDVGYGSRKLITEAFKRADQPIATDRIDSLQKDFLRLYAEDIARLSRPFPGVIDGLKSLKTQGAYISVCTNKPGHLARSLIKTLNMEKLFIRVVGYDDVPHKKPNPAHIFRTVGHRHAHPIVMIGDSLPDILAAKNAKVPSIAVSYGYSTIPAKKLGADAVIRNFRDLPSALDCVLKTAP